MLKATLDGSNLRSRKIVIFALIVIFRNIKGEHSMKRIIPLGMYEGKEDAGNLNLYFNKTNKFFVK